MPKPTNPKPPYPPQFRQQMVELVGTDRRPSELAKVFGCHETSILAWVRIARAATPSLSDLPQKLRDSERAELMALRLRLCAKKFAKSSGSETSLQRQRLGLQTKAI